MFSHPLNYYSVTEPVEVTISLQNDLFNLINMTEMPVPCQKGAAISHATCGNPNIVYSNFSASFLHVFINVFVFFSFAATFLIMFSF